MGKDIEMKPSDSPDKDADAPAEAVNGKPDSDEAPPLTPLERLRANLSLLEKAVRMKETRLITGRLLRQTGTVRHRMSPADLAAFVKENIPEGLDTRSQLLGALSKADSTMETDNGAVGPASSSGAPPPAGVLPETEAYAYVLVLMFLSDHKQYAEARELAVAALARLAAFNRRTLDGLAARLYFYYSWAHEQAGDLASIRSTLLGLHRTAVLRHDEWGQEVLLNLLLRNYLHYNLYDQAEKLRSKAQRPEQARSSVQLVRYLFYLGRIRAVQLEYTDAKDCLQQAVRKAPSIAHGFRVTAQKWLVLVRLLLGEIPDYLDLQAPAMRQPLAPYLQLAQAVRAGDLAVFERVAAAQEGVWQADRVGNLVARLRHNVIRAGLRRIAAAYSRISLADVAARLGLPNTEDTESIVAKAIRDGSIDAVIDHGGGFMRSRETADVYATDEPRQAFHARVAFCLDIHNEAVRAMRFEPDAHKRRLETEAARKERVSQEAELAKALEEDAEEGF